MFTGPLTKLAAGNRELDYRLRTADPPAARRMAGDTAGIHVDDDAGTREAADALRRLAEVLVNGSVEVGGRAPVAEQVLLGILLAQQVAVPIIRKPAL
ncbi:hypothetical protein Nm8I071_36340 [Nonomuraea sp. TT08I-71]|nr:hypothetical protein Nm8I071_36340 [Nonomuraea sp. TT08I-71]